MWLSCGSHKLNQTLYDHSKAVFTLTVLKSGDLISGSSDKTIKVWNGKN